MNKKRHKRQIYRIDVRNGARPRRMTALRADDAVRGLFHALQETRDDAWLEWLGHFSRGTPANNTIERAFAKARAEAFDGFVSLLRPDLRAELDTITAWAKRHAGRRSAATVERLRSELTRAWLPPANLDALSRYVQNGGWAHDEVP